VWIGLEDGNLPPEVGIIVEEYNKKAKKRRIFYKTISKIGLGLVCIRFTL